MQQRRHYVVNKLMFLLTAFLFCFHQISSFCFQQQQQQRQQQLQSLTTSAATPNRRIQQTLWAKPPPTSNFDLDAIEAMEKKLELERLNAMKGAEEENEDAGNVDDLLAEDEEEEESSDTVQEFTIPEELNGKRIDAALTFLIKEPTTLSRSICGNLVADGMVVQIEEDGKKDTILNRKSHKVQTGNKIRVEIPREEKPVEIIPENLPLDILFEDEHMIVLNKAAGMVVHPAAGNWDGTVVNALAYYLANDSPYGKGDFVDRTISGEDSDDPTGADGEQTISFRPGIVHRLDKGTTGVLVVAKTTQALAELSSAFADRTVKKTYLAVTVGNPGKRVTIDRPIGRHPIHRQKMRVVPDPHRKNSSRMSPQDRLRMLQGNVSTSQAGRRAISHVDTLTFDGKLSLVQVRIETGRTHQIRVHLQDRHTPIYGDDVYGLADWNKRLMKTHAIERPLLHAYRLEVNHPISGERMVFIAPLADDMKNIARAIWPQGQEERPELFE